MIHINLDFSYVYLLYWNQKMIIYGFAVLTHCFLTVYIHMWQIETLFYFCATIITIFFNMVRTNLTASCLCLCCLHNPTYILALIGLDSFSKKDWCDIKALSVFSVITSAIHGIQTSSLMVKIGCGRARTLSTSQCNSLPCRLSSYSL
jgi:hypothetical protein